jgi:hypothetical protein
MHLTNSQDNQYHYQTRHNEQLPYSISNNQSANNWFYTNNMQNYNMYNQQQGIKNEYYQNSQDSTAMYNDYANYCDSNYGQTNRTTYNTHNNYGQDAIEYKFDGNENSNAYYYHQQTNYNSTYNYNSM